MNIIVLVIGFLIALRLIVRFRQSGIERKKWVYPLFLATFPVYYWAFAVCGSDFAALHKEITVGAGFIALAAMAYRVKGRFYLGLLAAGYISHAVYDAVHNSLFVNAGTPAWWPEFCGAVDVLIGLYFVYLSLKPRDVANSR